MSQKSKFNKNKIKNSKVDARLTNHFYLSEEHVREAERYNEKAKNLAKELKSMTKELEEATKLY